MGYATHNLTLLLLADSCTQMSYEMWNFHCHNSGWDTSLDNFTSRIAELLKVGDTQVNVKATTTEKLGSIGRGEGIAAQATVMIQRDTYDR